MYLLYLLNVHKNALFFIHSIIRIFDYPNISNSKQQQLVRLIDFPMNYLFFPATLIHPQHSRANIKLNGKKIYGADGWAVREMMKVATLLRSALEAPVNDDQHPDTAISYDFTNRVGDQNIYKLPGNVMYSKHKSLPS